MERWGSSYFLHDVTPTTLVGGLGASTNASGRGTIRLSFAKGSEALDVRYGGDLNELVAKWEVAVKLVALLHILVVQNKLLRAEQPVLSTKTNGPPLFEVRADAKSGIVCRWPVETDGIDYNPTPDPESPDQAELLLSEPVAIHLIAGVVEAIARRGVGG